MCVWGGLVNESLFLTQFTSAWMQECDTVSAIRDKSLKLWLTFAEVSSLRWCWEPRCAPASGCSSWPRPRRPPSGQSLLRPSWKPQPINWWEKIADIKAMVWKIFWGSCDVHRLSSIFLCDCNTRKLNWNNIWERWDLNLWLLGNNSKCYHWAMLSPYGLKDKSGIILWIQNKSGNVSARSCSVLSKLAIVFLLR